MYLDQNKWVELLRIDNDSNSSEQDHRVLDLLRISVAMNRVTVPLSASHYLETWHRREWTSRHALAKLMRELSGYITLAPVQRILCWEIERLLLDHFRSPRCSCNLPDIPSLAFGYGADHAFSSATGRMRLVERIAHGETKEGPPIRPSNTLTDLLSTLKENARGTYEWWSLAGGTDPLEYADFETRSEHRLGTDRVQFEEDISDTISADSYLRRRLDDYLIARELIAANDVINQIAFWHNSCLDLLKERWMDEGPSFGRFLLDSIPTRACIFHARKAKHANLQSKWEQHDQTDIAALSVAIPYCDVVVTERQWTHVFRSAHLDHRYGTTVISKLDDLVPILIQALES